MQCSVELTKLNVQIDSIVEEPRRTRSKGSNLPPPAKRARRLASTPHTSNRANENRGNNNVADTQDDSLSKVIAMNCKITNELIATKKQLSDKNDLIVEMHKEHYDKNIECKALEITLAKKETEIKKLLKEIEKLKAEKFCDDLINLEDVPENLSRKSFCDII